MKMVKSIAAGLTAAAAIGAAAAGVTSIMAGGPVVYQMQPVVFGAPPPLTRHPPRRPDRRPVDQPAQQPRRSQRVVCEQGQSGRGRHRGTEARIADHKLKKAAEHGDLPLSFSVTNIQPAAAGSATADVSVSGPKLVAGHAERHVRESRRLDAVTRIGDGVAAGRRN